MGTPHLVYLSFEVWNGRMPSLQQAEDSVASGGDAPLESGPALQPDSARNPGGNRRSAFTVHGARLVLAHTGRYANETLKATPATADRRTWKSCLPAAHFAGLRL